MSEPRTGLVVPSGEAGVSERTEVRADRELASPRLLRPIALATGDQVKTSIVVDVAALAASVVATIISLRRAEIPLEPVALLAVYPAVVLFLLWLRRSYVRRLTFHLLDELREVVFTSALAAMIVVAARALLWDQRHLATQSLRSWLFAALTLGLARIVLVQLQRRRWRSGRGLRRTLIIGADRVGHQVARRLLENPQWGLLPVGFLDGSSAHAAPGDGAGVPVLGGYADLDRVVGERELQHVVVAFSTSPYEDQLPIVRRCEELGLVVSVVPRLFERLGPHLVIEHVGGLPLLTPWRPNPRGWQFTAKYALDRLLAAGLLLLALPIIALAALFIYCSMGRPIFYRQRRMGLDSHLFDVLKLRTMRAEAVALEASPAAVHEHDEALVPTFGRFLRATSLDELPQLMNVLVGDMSLVGPRPERPELAGLFRERINRYDDRHRVKAGVTGWAQVHGIGRGDDRFSDSSLANRVEWDNYYIENWSFWLDIKILFMTLAAVCQFRQR